MKQRITIELDPELVGALALLGPGDAQFRKQPLIARATAVVWELSHIAANGAAFEGWEREWIQRAMGTRPLPAGRRPRQTRGRRARRGEAAHALQ